MKKIETGELVTYIDDNCEVCKRLLTSEECEKGDMSGLFLCDGCRMTEVR